MNSTQQRNHGFIRASHGLAYVVGNGMALVGVGLIVLSEQPLFALPLGVLMMALGYGFKHAIRFAADYVEHHPNATKSDFHMIKFDLWRTRTRLLKCSFGKHLVIAESCTCFFCGKAFPDYKHTYVVELTDGRVVQVQAALESIALDVLVYGEDAELASDDWDERLAFSAGGGNPPRAPVVRGGSTSRRLWLLTP